MLENDRDEINYHKFLKSVRSAQKVSMEKVALGVCTKSGMCRIESGSRLPDKLVRDRLTARLGISGEEYEEYLLPREYEQWEKRMEIIRCIDRKELDGIEEKIGAYEKAYDTNQVDIQFVEAMRFMVMEMRGASDDELFEQIGIALECTVLDMDAALDGAHLLADQELNLIMEYVRLKKAATPKRELTEWKLKEYDKIAGYVERSRMDKIAQAKVYSKLACLISELVLAEHATEESLRYALEMCTRGIEVLRDMLRLYYFVELNEYRMRLIEALRDCAGSDSKTEAAAYKESREWNRILRDLYKENGISVYMDNFLHLYAETWCNNARDVIRTRRSMMGQSRQKLSGSVCDEKTLMRLELEQGGPSMVTVRDLFERIGLCAEYKRARVVTSNADILYLSREMFDELDKRKHAEAMQYIKEITNYIDMDIACNEQEMKRQELLIMRREQSLSNSSQTELLTDILECTLSIDALMSPGEKYLTRTELACVHDFAAYTEGKEQVRSREIMEEMCSKALELDEFECNKVYIYELIMTEMACIYGDEGSYEKSDKVSNKLLKESLRTKRMNSLTECIYNNLWNYQQNMEEKNDDYILQVLRNAYLLSDLAKDDGWKDFFQQKLNGLS